MSAMDAVTLHRLWDRAAIYLTGTGHQPSRLLVLGTALVALAAVASSRIWPVARTVVTIAHEGGHALMALLAGRVALGHRHTRGAAQDPHAAHPPAGQQRHERMAALVGDGHHSARHRPDPG